MIRKTSKPKVLSLVLIISLASTISASPVQNDEDMIKNPMMWADVPDPDVICVGDYFYLVSTTMHLMPGAPVMRSKDLANWETVSYVFDRLTDSPRYDLLNGTVYGRGQWATSLKYNNGRFYALFAPNEAGPMGQTYIYSTTDPTTEWTLVSRLPHFHDASLFFDDDGHVYVIHATGLMTELKPDLSGVVEGSDMRLFERDEEETGLLEGSRMIKHNGRYYLLMISQVYAPGRHRREVCYRADNIHGPYEKRVILEAPFDGLSYVGQGTIVDSKDGDWYGIIFQDRGAVGRILTLMPCRWIDGWPMLGDEEGQIPLRMRKMTVGEPMVPLVAGDDFTSSQLSLRWQWNHNPINQAWSLTERPGHLRLKTCRVVPNLYVAPNTLTQRMEGPQCSACIVVDLSHMKDGDCAGLAAFNSDSGILTVKKSRRGLSLQMSEQSVSLSESEKIVEHVDEKVIETIDLKQTTVWLRIDGDFRRQNDIATFYYSLDGEQWTKIGSNFKMQFDWRRFFMGTKYALFCYATKRLGGYVDIDQFNYCRGARVEG